MDSTDTLRSSQPEDRPPKTGFGSQWRVLWRLLRQAFPGLKRRLTVLTLLAVVGALIEAAIVLMIAALGSALIDGIQQVDQSLGGISINLSTTGLSLLVIGAAVARTIVDLLLVELRARTESSFEEDARRRVIRLYFAADWELQSEERAGGMQALLVAFITHARGLLQQTIATVVAAASLLIMLAASFLVGRLATLATITFMALAALLFRPFIRHSRLAALENRDATIRFSDQISETVAMALEVRTLGATEPIKARLDTEVAQLAAAQYRSSNAQYRLQAMHRALTFTAVGVGMFVVSALVVADPRPYAAMLLLLYRAMNYGRGVQSGYQAIISSQPYLEELQLRLARYRGAAEARGAKEVETGKQVVVDNVSFTYPDGSLALQGISFSLSPDEALGVVGPSGSGKSTLVQLLLGLRHPQTGLITLDGLTLGSISPPSLTRHIGYVPQEGRLFDATVLDNVICYRNWISREAAISALRQAQILDDVICMPNGLDSSVGVGGRRLSGGQRQRVCIARALAGGPQLLILDEPTSALDLASEEAIRLTLEELRGQICLVIIAHRMSTLRVCDRLLVLRDGSVEDLGTRRELEKSSSYYAEALRLTMLS